MKRKKAFTLLEMIITALITSIVLVGTIFVLRAAYQATDMGTAINNSNMTADAIHSEFSRVIKPSKKVNWINSYKFEVTATNGTITKYEYKSASHSLYKNDKLFNVISLSNTKNDLTLTFSKGNPLERVIGIKLVVNTKTADYACNSGFDSQFYCRNK